jgi:hypothetical protein
MSDSPTHTKGPLAWQKFGDRWCLTGQYGMRPIVFSCGPRGDLMLRDAAKDRLIPFSPDHPDARLWVAAPDLLEALKPFAEICPGSLDGVGGGTQIAPTITVQMVKEARAAIARATPESK